MGAARAQVVVIGGGVIGASCAWALVRRGVAVTLLEAQDLAAGASGACDGHLTVQTKAPGLHTELAVRSLELYHGLGEGFAQAAELRCRGSLLVAVDEAEAGALQKLAAAREAAGAPVELLDGAGARTLEPALTPAVRGASYAPGDAQANPWRITGWLAREACRHGAQVLTRTPVRALRPQGNGVRLELAQGEMEADRVVVACGHQTPGLLEGLARVAIRPRRGQILVTERLPGLLRRPVVSASYLARKYDHRGPAAPALALEQTPEGNVLIGGTREYVGDDRDVTPEGMTALARLAAALVPALGRAAVVRSFAGLRPATEHGLPLVGSLPDFERVVVAAGHEGDGMTLAPVTGELVARWLVDDVPPPDELLLKPGN